jgi:hypothetical protein
MLMNLGCLWLWNLLIKLFVIKLGYVYGYGILMKICIDDWVVKCWIKNYVEMVDIDMWELLGIE